MSGRTLGDMRATAQAHCGEPVTRKNSEKVACNTLKFWDAAGNIYYLHHRTVIMTYYKDGAFSFTPEGWSSSTTANRVHRFGPEGLTIYRNRGRWFVCTGKYHRKYSHYDLVLMVDNGFITDNKGNLPDPPEGMCWGIHGWAVPKDEFIRQIVNRIVNEMRSHIQYRYDNILYGDDEEYAYVRDMADKALTWAGYPKRAIQYIKDKLFYAEIGYSQELKMRIFPPALSTITIAIRRYLTANPDVALAEWNTFTKEEQAWLN